MAISTFTRAPKESDFSNIETGKQLGQFSNIYRQQQAQEKQDQKEREASYLHQAKVDPIFTMSSYWQKEQGKKIQEFQDFLAKKYYQSKNRPRLQDQIEIQNHKQALFGWQQQLQSDQQKYQQAVKEIQKDPTGIKYDAKHFNERVHNWIDPNGDGKLSDDLLLSPLIPDLKAHNIAKDYTGKMEKNVTDKNGVRTTIEDLPEEKRKGKVMEDLFKNPSEFRSATEGFNKLAPEEKKKWLSKYPQGQEGDGIKDWYWENYGKYAYQPIKSTSPAPKGRQSKSADDLMSGSSSHTPTKTFALGTTEKSSKKTTEEGKSYTSKTPILSQIDQYGDGYSFAPGNYGDVFTDRYIDMNTGHLTPKESSQLVPLNNIQIKHVPYAEGYGISPSGKYRNKEGYKVKALVVTRDKNGDPIGLPLTDELKKQIISKHPTLKNKVMDIENEFIPEGEQGETQELESKQMKSSRFDKYKRK